MSLRTGEVLDADCLFPCSWFLGAFLRNAASWPEGGEEQSDGNLRKSFPSSSAPSSGRFGLPLLAA